MISVKNALANHLISGILFVLLYWNGCVKLFFKILHVTIHRVHTGIALKHYMPTALLFVRNRTVLSDS